MMNMQAGIPKAQLCRDVAELIAGEQTLLLAYNCLLYTSDAADD